ncbi:hypothetical protein NDU88_005001 [Pleurodeles waltl]|uniref:Uncharacterized protein n=1 Tax=Pleurodeles waltl TaxID=8319 RepID=A0AAV7QJY4_PLEWA|nr:hypothetical protein NDU88_005001 [Pleurodeles waltl]
MKSAGCELEPVTAAVERSLGVMSPSQNDQLDKMLLKCERKPRMRASVKFTTAERNWEVTSSSQNDRLNKVPLKRERKPRVQASVRVTTALYR